MLDDRPDLLAALLLGLAVFAFAELGRGILSGRHLFTEYGRYFAAEGISRMLIAGALVIVGIEMVGAYAITLAAAFLLGTLAAGFTVRPFVNPGPPSHLNELSALGLLLATSISEAFLLNVGPVALAIIGDELGEEAPGVFLNGLIISRIPLFFFQAVKARSFRRSLLVPPTTISTGSRGPTPLGGRGRSRRCGVHGGDRHGRAVGGRDRVR